MYTRCLKPQKKYKKIYGSRIKKKSGRDLDDPCTRWYEHSMNTLDLYEQAFNECVVIRALPTDLETRSGEIYPETLWYLLAPYIHPTDIGRFAGICYDAYKQTTLQRFWQRIYDRYCRDSPLLPLALLEKHQSKVTSLRTLTIKGLHHTVPEFSKRQPSNRFYELLGWKCDSIWYKKKRGYFHLYLKMMTVEAMSLKKERNFRPDVESVYDNEEEGCKIIMIKYACESHIPPIIGMCLVFVTMFVRRRSGQYVIQFNFTTNPDAYIGLETEFLVFINDVQKVQILNWWDKCYRIGTEAKHSRAQYLKRFSISSIDRHSYTS